MNKIIEAGGQSEARIWIAMSGGCHDNFRKRQLFRIFFDA